LCVLCHHGMTCAACAVLVQCLTACGLWSSSGSSRLQSRMYTFAAVRTRSSAMLVCWSSGCRLCAQSHAVLKSLSRAVIVQTSWSRPGQPMGNLQCFECLWQSIVCVLYPNHAYESVMHAGSQQRCAESSISSNTGDACVGTGQCRGSVAIPISQSLDGLSLKHSSAEATA
jgi:hypothetical protein